MYNLQKENLEKREKLPLEKSFLVVCLTELSVVEDLMVVSNSVVEESSSVEVFMETSLVVVFVEVVDGSLVDISMLGFGDLPKELKDDPDLKLKGASKLNFFKVVELSEFPEPDFTALETSFLEGVDEADFRDSSEVLLEVVVGDLGALDLVAAGFRGNDGRGLVGRAGVLPVDFTLVLFSLNLGAGLVFSGFSFLLVSVLLLGTNRPFRANRAALLPLALAAWRINSNLVNFLGAAVDASVVFAGSSVALFSVS